MSTVFKYIRDTIVWILMMLTIFLFIMPQFFTLGVIPSESMVPTLEVGDRIFCTHVRWNMIERGDLIVFHPNEEEGADQFVVKRVIGLSGDKVRLEGNKVYVNGSLLDEPYLGEPLDYTGSFVVPKDKYFLLGDNRGKSLDARFWENPFIDKSQLKYKALFRVYPFNKIGGFEPVNYKIGESSKVESIEDNQEIHYESGVSIN